MNNLVTLKPALLLRFVVHEGLRQGKVFVNLVVTAVIL